MHKVSSSSSLLLESVEISDYIHWFSQHFVTDPLSRGRTFQRRSPLENFRSSAAAEVPEVFQQSSHVRLEPLDRKFPISASVWPGLAAVAEGFQVVAGEEISDHRPIRGQGRNLGLGVVLTGNFPPAAGTINVVLGLVEEGRKYFGKISGFLDGPQGIASRTYVDLTNVDRKYLNQPGCDLLGFSSLRAMDARDCEEIGNILTNLEIDALVFVGGPDEISHVAQLVEFFAVKKFPITVISVFQSPNDTVHFPPFIDHTLGFDTAVVTLCELIGNLAKFPTGRFLVPSGSVARTEEVARRLGLGSSNVVLEISSREISDSTVLVADGVDVEELRVALERQGRNFRVLDLKMVSRMAFPTISDCSRGLALGLTAACLAAAGKHGNVAFAEPVSGFFGGFPLGAILRTRQDLPDAEISEPSSPELKKLARLKSFRESAVPEISIRRISASPATNPAPVPPGPYQFGIFSRKNFDVPRFAWVRTQALEGAFKGLEGTPEISDPRILHVAVVGMVGPGTAEAVGNFVAEAKTLKHKIFFWTHEWAEASEELEWTEICQKFRTEMPPQPDISDHLVIFGDREAVISGRAKYEGVNVLFVPCDSRNEISGVPRSVGFETTVRVFSAMLGSLSTMAASSKSDWAFVLVQGERMSRLVLQCARETNVHAAIVPEIFGKTSETQIVNFLADLVVERSSQGSDFGVVVISEDMRFACKTRPAKIHEYLRDKVAKELNRRAYLGNTKAMGSCRLFDFDIALTLCSTPHDADVNLGKFFGQVAAQFVSQVSALHEAKHILLVEMEESQWKPFAVSIAKEMLHELPLDRLVDLASPAQRRFVNMGPMQVHSTDALSGKTPNSLVHRLSHLHKLLHRLQLLASGSSKREAVISILQSAQNLINLDLQR